MLKELRISNIILIESAEIFFQEGLNVLTGETGAGKSAVMQALALITGCRAESTILRKGAEKGVVEATFELNEEAASLKATLAEAGIDHEDGEDLIIRREISASGKSRAFINNQMAQLNLLRNTGDHLIEIVGQHASQYLMSVERHRGILDLYGDLAEDISVFAYSWEKEIAVRKQLDILINSEAQRLRDIEVCLMELAELQEANLKEGEDESLFTEYSFLINAEELAGKVSALSQTLSGEKQSVLAQLNRQKSAFEEVAAIDPHLADASKAYQNALLELQEISYTLTAYQSRLESNPARTAEVNDRLSLINRLKRKYGANIQEILNYQKNAGERLKSLETADTQIEDLQVQLKALESANHALAAQLTEKRKKAAGLLQKAVVKQLRSLNMPKVEFVVEISPQKRSRTGDDLVEFFLIPNIGEHRIPIKDCASGGELSRLMLSMQTILAGKEQIPTLVFDEIDANIGGATAVVVGEKLREIGSKHQVLCITHFPQVAKQASHHLQISKQEQKGRTITKVHILDGHGRQKELERMLGVSPERFIGEFAIH